MVSLRALLIQKSIKLSERPCTLHGAFESFVNSEEYQTLLKAFCLVGQFESFVNSEEYQTPETETA